MKKPILIGIFASLASLSFAQNGPAGYYYSDDNCASGGGTQYFFENNVYIYVCNSCDDRPFINLGTWKKSGDEVKISLNTRFRGIGENYIPDGSNNASFESYKAEKTKINESSSLTWSEADEDDGCETTGLIEGEVADVRYFLRNSLERRYDFSSSNVLTEGELMQYSKEELRYMRNEIFAAYGYEFKTADMKKLFPGGYMSDVTAFLNEIETTNIDLIKKVEAKK